MKKHDEGYVLVLVLVVILVLSLVASAILGGALSNINAQHAQVEKMQDQYAAAGQIEILLTQLETADTWSGVEPSLSGMRSKVDGLCDGLCDDLCGGLTEVSQTDPEFADLADTYTFTVTAKAGDVQISTRLKLTLTVSGADITGAKAEYVSYKTEVIEEVGP